MVRCSNTGLNVQPVHGLEIRWKVEGRTLVFFLTGGTRFRLEVVIDHLGGVGVSLVELVLWHVHVVESGLGDSRAGH
jgi:hypothetical protein